jgi:hypothetical protein
MLSRGTFWKCAASSPDLNAPVKVEEKQGVTSDVFPRGLSSMQVPAVLDSPMRVSPRVSFAFLCTLSGKCRLLLASRTRKWQFEALKRSEPHGAKTSTRLAKKRNAEGG